MEAYAILALHAVGKYMDNDHLLEFLNGCDSKAAIQTYTKLERLNRMQLPKLANSDIWRLILMYKQYWGTMHQYHIPSHMDDFVEDEEDLLLPWKWNIMVDSLADEYYDEDHMATDNRNFAARLPGILYYGTEPITVPIGKWARAHTALKRVRTCFEEHHPGALSGIPIDWSCMASISKHQNRVWQRIRLSKLVWDMFAFQHLQMTRGHCSPSDVNCTFCGKVPETQAHVFSECDSPTVTGIMDAMFLRTSAAIQEVLPDCTAKWLCNHIKSTWRTGAQAPSMTPLAASKLLPHTSRTLRSGLVPAELVEFLKNQLPVKREKSAYKLAVDLSSIARSALCEVWDARGKALEQKRAQGPQKQLAATSAGNIRDQARSLISQNLLHQPDGTTYTLSEFDGLPRKTRAKLVKSTVRKLNKNTGTGSNYSLPLIGQKVRSYVLSEERCVSAQAVVAAYDPGSAAPYLLREEHHPHRQVWAGPTDTARRLEQPNGLTAEEQLVHNERIYKVFSTPTPTPEELLSDERRLKAGKTTNLTSCKTYLGGVYQVYREQHTTYLDTIYEDLDSETLTMGSLIENCAFHEDISKRQRIKYLMSKHKWALDPRTGKFLGDCTGAVRKTKQSRRKRGATKKATSALQQRLKGI